MGNNNVISADNSGKKEYQIPELVDLNSINEECGLPSWCTNGSSATVSCGSGSAPG